MHETSLQNMKSFKEKYLAGSGKVLDVGSMDVNGTYRDIFSGWEYTGFDIEAGNGVDVTDWKDINGKKYDVVISGQTFEHVKDDAELINRMAYVLKKGGYCCIIAPSEGPKHDYPKDYRRYQREDMIKIAEGAGLTVVEAKINGDSPWFDCVLVAQKVTA